MNERLRVSPYPLWFGVEAVEVDSFELVVESKNGEGEAGGSRMSR